MALIGNSKNKKKALTANKIKCTFGWIYINMWNSSLLLIATGDKLKNVRERGHCKNDFPKWPARRRGDCMTSEACLKARQRIAEAGRKVSFFEGPKPGHIFQEWGQPFSRSGTLFMTRGEWIGCGSQNKDREQYVGSCENLMNSRRTRDLVLSLNRHLSLCCL